MSSLFFPARSGRLHPDERHRPMSRHRLWGWFAGILLLRLAYLVWLYPGCIFLDTSSSVIQFFGYPDPCLPLSAADEGCTITNANPVMYLWLYGGLFALGQWLGSQNLALVLNALVQSVLSTWLLLRLAVFVERATGRPSWPMLLVYALLPPFGFWCTMMLKDVVFSIAMLWLMLCLAYVGVSGGRLARRGPMAWQLGGALLLFMLSKNQCFYIVVLMALFMLLFRRPWLRRAWRPVVGALVVYRVGIVGLLLPLCHVAPSGRQEMLGFLFQQTALCVKEHPTGIRPSEQAAIRAVLPYDSLAMLYDPSLQDPVKFRYRAHASGEDFSRYLRKAQLPLMWRYPLTCLRASWGTCCDYFRPTLRSNLAYAGLEMVNPPGPSFFSVHGVEGRYRPSLHRLTNMPVVGWPLVMALWVWAALLLALGAALTHRRVLLLVALPAVLQILVLTVSPMNGCFRYVMPVVWAVPFLASLWPLRPDGERRGPKPSAS